MLFFPNATAYISSLTTIKNAEGTKIKTYDFEKPLESFRIDVQPNTLTSAQIELYGLSAKNAHTKKCFVDIENANNMVPGNRAKIIYDDGNTEYYDIQPVNSWRFHKEFLLIPVENENNG